MEAPQLPTAQGAVQHLVRAPEPGQGNPGAANAGGEGNQQQRVVVGLTPEEEEWAMGIKEIIEMEPGLEPLNDYWYAQLALDCQDDVNLAATKAHQRQAFMEDYRVVDTVQQGIRCVEEFMDAFPGYLLHVSTTDSTNGSASRGTIVIDNSKCDNIVSPKAIRGLYYLCQAMCSDFAQIQMGANMLFEFEGYDWKANWGWKDYQKWWEDWGSWYPIVYHKMTSFHTGTLATVVLTLAKKLFPTQAQRNLFEFGYYPTIPRLDQLYMVPTVEANRARILEQVRLGLERRYTNEASFSLPE